MKLTPLKIEILMHIYAMGSQIRAVEYPAQQAALQEFHELALICHDLMPKPKNSEHKLLLTDRGLAFVKMILATPLPQTVTTWGDPRFPSKFNLE